MRLSLLALSLHTACFPTTITDTGDGPCALLDNGDAEAGDTSNWTVGEGGLVEAVRVQDQSDGTVLPAEGSWFFSMANDATGSATLVHSCSPAPMARRCTLSGQVQTEGLGEPPDHGTATLAFLDAEGTIIAESSTTELSTASLEWRSFEISEDVALDATTIQVTLHGSRQHGDHVNVFWDILSIECTDAVSSAS